MSRNAFVPMSWITSDLNGEALRTLILISTFADGKTGECHPSNALLGKTLGKCDRAIRKAISEIQQAGFLSIHDGAGKGRTFRIETPEWYAKPGTKRSALNPEQNVPSSDDQRGTFRSGFDETTRNETFQQPGTKRSANPEQNVPGPNKNTVLNNGLNTLCSSGGFSEESKPDAKATTTTIGNLELFESENPAPLPNVRNAVEPFRPRLVELKPTIFKTETRDRMMSVLGMDAEQFARKVTQEQADAGFVDWILGECKRNKTPGRLAFHLLKTAWREGWIDPKAEEEAKRAARRKRLEALQ